MKKGETLAFMLRRRMIEIDSDISKSMYNGGDDSNDRPPTGDDYNLLWDAILDEIRAVYPKFTMVKGLNGSE